LFLLTSYKIVLELTLDSYKLSPNCNDTIWWIVCTWLFGV